MKRPENLETLANYSAHSNIDPQFAETVRVLKPSVTKKAGELGDLKKGFGREMMIIVIGQDNPFKDEVLAQYVLQFGTAVALTRTKTLDSDPQRILHVSTHPEPEEESGLMLEIYKSWAAAKYLEAEAEVVCKDKPFHLKIKHTFDMLTGRAITETGLDEKIRFLEGYLSDPLNINYLHLLADSASSLG